MQERMWTVVRILLVVALLIFTATAAFVAGFGVSRLLGMSADLVPWPTAIPSSTTAPAATPPAGPSSADSDEDTFRVFWEAWEIVQRDFYGDLPDLEAVTYAAIRGMLETLGDEHTSFLEPQIADILSEDFSGSFEGIGAYVRMREDGKLEISGVFAGQPADQAGLRAEDRVLAVNGESILGYDIYQAIALIRGPAGTEVTLLVERPHEPETFEVTLTRARITPLLVESEMLEGNIAYIGLTDFDATATAQMEDELDWLLAQEPLGLILDLRGNLGGLREQAFSVADLFLDDGVIFIQRSSDGEEETFYSQDGDRAESIPLVVLVNGSSASASEIVAGAIQDRGRGILIGEQTFGKGSVQRPYGLSDGSELRVTIARWFTPNDTAIQGEGLIPDIEILELEEDQEAGQDPQLGRAVEYLLTGE